ncbi:MAG TPA: hypothetical protein VFU49_18450 [Ktedonobacteraceae bacterium]|nr:hypothetical protein [Ktedonobacteraceae bacterium]
MSHNDWHLTTEELSALLDGQLSSEEQAQQHLNTCKQCQLRLADLRQTVQLLHALPQPHLPRSFTLPVSDAVVTPISAHRDSGVGRLNSQPAPQLRRRARSGYMRTTMRTLSTLAAVLGIVFLLSTALPFAQGNPAAAPSTSFGSAPANTAAATKDQSQTGQGALATKTAPQTTLTPRAVTPRATATPETTAHAFPLSGTPVHPLIDLNNAGERALLGLALLILGILSLILLSRRRASKR